MICGTCRFWEPHEISDGREADAGICRRAPPVANQGSPYEHDYDWARWPVSARGAWCGEYQVKEQKAEP